MTLSLLPMLAALLVAPSGPGDTIVPDDLRPVMNALAADTMQGREPGTAGGELAEAYLIQAFAAAGLEPGADGGTWRQAIHMAERRPLSVPALAWRRGGSRIVIPPAETAVLTRDARTQIVGAPLLFVGYGTAEDVARADLHGAVLLRLADDPPPGRFKLSSDALRARGAVGILGIEKRGTVWSERKSTWLRRARNFMPSTAIGLEGLISVPGAARLLGAAGRDLGVLEAKARGAAFSPVSIGVGVSVRASNLLRPFETANIVGRIEGRLHPEQAVVLLAHWDHLGICRPVGAPDRICNGAVDNASGVSALIEVAKRLARGERPDRSIYIVATTAEEMGHRGAAHFAASPPAPIGRIVAALNMDSIAVGPAGLDVAVIGRGRYPALDAVVDETVRSLGHRASSGTQANVMLTRQDGWAFDQRGIPAVMVSRSVSDMSVLRRFLESVYHGPYDDIAHAIDLSGAAEDAFLNLAIARALSDARFSGRQP